jgi:hypothetical protein
MIVWGGYDPDTPDVSLATGGRYDPVTDQWRTMSIADAAVGRSDHKAVWTGDAMIVWGGNSQIISAIQLLNSGGRYVVAPVVDADGDGFAACSVDCDDGNPSIYPGAPQTCGDGLNTDCSDPAWPSLSGTGDVDGDSDGVRQCQNDCNDANGVIWGIPSGVGGLEVADIPGGFRVMWASQSSTAGSGTVYDVFGGPGSTLSGTGSFSSGSCYLEDDPSAQFDYTGPDPPVGDAYYFMIRGQNACPGGTGTYGNSNRDSTAGASSIPCQ